jgi:phosphoglycerate dehydrogenase-like enzyme
MLMLVLLRRLVQAHELTRSGKFAAFAYLGANQPHLRELGDETVGLVGLGNIGHAVAERLRGFRARVMYFARHRVSPELEAELGVQYAAFKDLLSDATIVSLHLPSTPETRYLIGTAELGCMSPKALLVSTSRGDLIDEAALSLRAAIENGRLAGAGLDVIEDEFHEVNPFADLPQVIVTPHSGGVSTTNLPRALRQGAANIERFLSRS